PAWGLVAEHGWLVGSSLAAAACRAAGVATVRFWPLYDTRDMNREPAAYWAPPRLAVEPDPDAGPVVVTLAYTVAPEDEDEFRAAMLPVRRSRLRSGAVQWGLFRDGEVPDRLVEAYVVPTWQEHMYQHDHRLTGTDQEIELRARALSRTDPEVAHLLPIDGTDPRGLGS